jgi:hypothetical protein
MLEEDEKNISLTNTDEISKRMSIVMKMAKNGQVTFRNCKEARPAGDLNSYINANPFRLNEECRPMLRMTPSKFNFLVEGYDFTITPLGEIKLKH